MVQKSEAPSESEGSSETTSKNKSAIRTFPRVRRPEQQHTGHRTETQLFSVRLQSSMMRMAFPDDFRSDTVGR